MQQDLYGSLKVLEPREQPFTKEERLKAMVSPMLGWFKNNARVLPWRQEPTPYRVWVSEIMLQQTRVEAVKPYFERFMSALPDVAALAAAPEEKLMKLWEGLGYYNRVRNMQKAAVTVMEEYGGGMPASYEELLKLKGIGSYTAGAISSIAFGIPVPAVDGNVLRVISRLTASREDISRQTVKAQMEKDLKSAMPQDGAGDFNQALMEIGALICVPGGAPKCQACPLNTLCLASREGLTEEIPVKAAKKGRRVEEKTVFLIEYNGSIAIRKRPDTGLLAGLYEYPNTDGALKQDEAREYLLSQGETDFTIEPLPPAKHIFSHVEWHMQGYCVRLLEKRGESFLYADAEALQNKYAVPAAFAAYTRLVPGICR
jgi:A/G-specific adenine glycosylase